MDKNKDMSRQEFLKMVTLTGAAICIGPTLDKVTTAERVWVGKRQVANDIPANMAAVYTRRTLGRGSTAFTVSAMGYSCMSSNHSRGQYPSREKETALMHEVVERGVTLLDTAEGCGYHINEKLVSEASKGYIDWAFVSSKFGHRSVNGVQIKTEGDSTPVNIRRVCENLLRNPGVKTLGMSYQHRINPNTPIEVVVEACSKLIKEGKILHWGICKVNVDTIRRARKICPVAAIQSKYHLVHRMVEANGVLELCEDLGIGFVPYSSLNRGFLGGTTDEYAKFDAANDNRQTSPCFQPEAIRADYRTVEVLNAFDRTRGIAPAQVALVWLMNKKPFIVSISDTIRLSHLEENLRARDIHFTAEEVEGPETAMAAISTVGSRYDALQESRIPK